MLEHFLFEFGMEYNQIGMQYRTSEDTTFIGYERKKQGIVAPIRGTFQWGDDFKIQLGGGFAPRMFTASKYKTIVLNDFGQEEETIVKQTDGYNYFNVDVLLNVGFRWNLSQNFGLYFLPEFRYSFLDTYNKQQPYVQHNYGLFLRWGIHLLI
jgi:hypothetical protein